MNKDLMRVVKRAQEISQIKLHVHEELRTIERQAEMMRRGWSKTMNSKPLTGRAVDVRADGDPAVGALDAAKYAKINDARKKAAKELDVPVQWGGDSFGKFKDMPHFQLPDACKSNAGAYTGDNQKDVAPQASIMRGIPNAALAVRQAEAAQAAVTSNTTNDNRSFTNHDTRFTGPITIQTAATDADGILADLGSRARNNSAASANDGQALRSNQLRTIKQPRGRQMQPAGEDV